MEGTRVLDLRRHDERTLYGSIPGGKPLLFGCNVRACASRKRSGCKCRHQDFPARPAWSRLT